MLAYTFRRSVAAVVVLFLVSIIVFVLIRLAPGDPATNLIGPEGSIEQRDELLERWGLNEPYHVQYAKWISNAVRGDFGATLASRVPVTELVLPRVTVSLLLATIALLIAIAWGVPAGVLAASNRRGPLDIATTTFSVAGLAMPNFWIGLMAIYFFSIRLDWLPAIGWVNPWVDPAEYIKHAILPSTILALPAIATLTRMVRASMLEVVGEDYIRTARAKGISNVHVTMRHAFRNALLPPITALGLLAGTLLAGSVIIEQIFVIPGMGSAFLRAIQQRDYPTIQFLVLVYALFFIVINLVTDLLYGLADPRIRYS
jgi:peptide/nickel transport system permease protein